MVYKTFGILVDPFLRNFPEKNKFSIFKKISPKKSLALKGFKAMTQGTKYG